MTPVEPVELCAALPPPPVEDWRVKIALDGLGQPAWAGRAATLLVQLGARSAVPDIERAWANSPDDPATDRWALRSATATAIACFAADEADALVRLDALGHPDAPGRPDAPEHADRPHFAEARGDDPVRWAALSALGPRARAAQAELAQALEGARYVEEDDRVGLDQVRVARITTALGAIGIDDEAVATRLLRWNREGFPRTRPSARWEGAIVDPLRTALAGPLLRTLRSGAPPAGELRFAIWQLGRLGATEAAPLLLDRLAKTSRQAGLGEATGGDDDELWQALTTIGRIGKLDWTDRELTSRSAPVKALTAAASRVRHTAGEAAPEAPRALRLLVRLASAGQPDARLGLARLRARPDAAELLADYGPESPADSPPESTADSPAGSPPDSPADNLSATAAVPAVPPRPAPPDPDQALAAAASSCVTEPFDLWLISGGDADVARLAIRCPGASPGRSPDPAPPDERLVLSLLRAAALPGAEPSTVAARLEDALAADVLPSRAALALRCETLPTHPAYTSPNAACVAVRSSARLRVGALVVALLGALTAALRLARRVAAGGLSRPTSGPEKRSGPASPSPP